MTQKRILLAPLDPVHDIGIKMINKVLEDNGHITYLLPPDRKTEEIVKEAENFEAEYILISRTLGYRVEELLSKFVDLLEASGIREHVKLVIGGMAIKPELAQELGFDAGFGAGTDIEEVLAYIEDRKYVKAEHTTVKEKTDMTDGYSYQVHYDDINKLLEQITDKLLKWSKDKTSPAVERAKIREKILQKSREGAAEKDLKHYWLKYAEYCDPEIASWYKEGKIHEKANQLTEADQQSLRNYVERVETDQNPRMIQHDKSQPQVFVQYGTGCPFMDIAHIKLAEGWGADGVVHFDPSWNSRTEGLLEGFLTHQDDGSLITPENLQEIKYSLNPATLWQVRAHRGLNTPETVVNAGFVNADLTKINIAYGSLGAGTDPARLTIDGIKSIQYASRFNIPFDVVTNEELCGVPAYKAFASMIIGAYLARKLGGKPILQPLFCYSPEVMINGYMEENYVDFNAAKIYALKEIMDAPIWPGAPIGFLTHTEDRVQASTTTALHAGLAASLGVDGISISSSDEAYSGGPITAPSRIDTLKSTGEINRFLGKSLIQPTEKAERFKEDLLQGIKGKLKEVNEMDNFVAALYEGVVGSSEDGAYPGRSGRGTVTSTHE